MESAVVSIITPTYNSAKFIAATIDSVKQQTYAHWELIVVDDASADDTVRIVSALAEADSRIKLHRLTHNAGAGIARATAVENAAGDYIAFLDADDLWYPGKLQKQLAWMHDRKLPFTFSFYDCIDEEGRPTGKQVRAPRELSYRQLFFCNYVGNLTGIYSKDYFGKIAIDGIRKRQDWMMWLTILKNIRKAYPVPEALASYRIRSGSISSGKARLLTYNYSVYRKYHKLNVVAAIACMAVFICVQLLVKPIYIKQLKSQR